MTGRRNFWFPERERDGDPRWPWCPSLQTDGMCLSLDVHFATAEECMDWIRREVVEARVEE